VPEKPLRLINNCSNSILQDPSRVPLIKAHHRGAQALLKTPFYFIMRSPFPIKQRILTSPQNSSIPQHSSHKTQKKEKRKKKKISQRTKALGEAQGVLRQRERERERETIDIVIIITQQRKFIR
jgi:hypothetical protein